MCLLFDRHGQLLLPAVSLLPCLSLTSYINSRLRVSKQEKRYKGVKMDKAILETQSARSLPDEFYTETARSCPRADCSNTTVFKPNSFTQHMKSEHGDPKNMECMAHEACRTIEPRRLYNAFTLQMHMKGVKCKADIKAKGKQPCGHDDCRGATERYAQEQLEHHQKLYHGELRNLYCTEHDRCKSKMNPRSYNTYGLSQHLKSVEKDRRALLLARRCSHPDCSGNEDLYSKRQMKHHCKAEHGERKDLRCSQHLKCIYKTTQYNEYTFSLHMRAMGYYNRRMIPSFAQRCTHPECARSRRKFSYGQMKWHWMTRHGGPTSLCQAHASCKGSRKKYNKFTLSSHIATVRRMERSMTQGPWLRCSYPPCVDTTEQYHPIALARHQRGHKNQQIHRCNDGACEDHDELFDWKALQEHRFEHAMKDSGCVQCDHDDCVGSPLWFVEALLVVHKEVYHKVKHSERCPHVDCHGSEHVYNLWTMIEHRLCHQAPVSSLVEFEDEGEDEDEDEESSGVIVNVENDSKDDRDYANLDFDDLDLDDLDLDEQDEQGNDDQASSDSDSEYAGSEEAFGQLVKDRTSIAHDDNKASHNIEIDESPRTLQIIFVAVSEDKPAHWRVRNINCPVMGCLLNRPDGLSLQSIHRHVENEHGLSRHDPRLGISGRACCTVPGCKHKKPLRVLRLLQHVRELHGGFDTILCVHVDCKNNQTRYTPTQARRHMSTVHAPKIIKCKLPGCEASEVVYNRLMLYQHTSSCHVKLSCLKPDCGTTVCSWRNLRRHLFVGHDVQVSLEHVRAAASGSVTIEFHSHSTSELQTIQGNALTAVGQFGSADDHHIEEEEEEDSCSSEDGSYSMDERVEDSDDSISVEDSDIDDSGDEADSAPGPKAETVNRRGEIEMILRCAISVCISRPSVCGKESCRLMMMSYFSLSTVLKFGLSSKNGICSK